MKNNTVCSSMNIPRFVIATPAMVRRGITLVNKNHMLIIDGFVKSPSMPDGMDNDLMREGALRFILSHCGVPAQYASFPRNRAPCIGNFLLFRMEF